MTLVPTYCPQKHTVVSLSSLSCSANQAPIEFDGTAKDWMAGPLKGAHVQRPLLFTDHAIGDKIPVDGSVWRDILDRELGTSLRTHPEDEVGKSKFGGNRAIDCICPHLYLLSQPLLITPAR